MAKHLNIRVSGKVQDVSFRYSAKQKADEFELNGLARNELGGTVYIEVEGEPEALEKFLQWCRQGSEYAEVTQINIAGGGSKGYQNFTIL